MHYHLLLVFLFINNTIVLNDDRAMLDDCYRTMFLCVLDEDLLVAFI